jgi:hypothetical protein
LACEEAADPTAIVGLRLNANGVLSMPIASMDPVNEGRD